jgi:tRNA-dihydrouridine synthase
MNGEKERPMFAECVIRGQRFAPARFGAPMAGYSHSAMRRLWSELGGCGALWTEMLAARQILSENFNRSPWLRRRPTDSPTVFQLMVRAGDPLERVLNRLGEHGVPAVDLNLACHAFSVRACAAGSALFEDLPALRTVVHEARRCWPGLLTAKLRLGRRGPDWAGRLAERVRLLEDAGLDALVMHPRFFEDKFKRRARLELIPWVASLSRLALIANGDLSGPGQVQARAEDLRPACAVMLGRMAVIRPWVFAAWEDRTAPDLAMVWRRLCGYVREDFSPVLALRRMKMFTRYFAANYVFGHQFHVQLANAASLEELVDSAEGFFARDPGRFVEPSISGRW